MNQVILTFNYSEFILQCPAYMNPVMYPQSTLQQYWNAAINYISDVGDFGDIQGDQRQFCINLMTAHLAFIAGLVAAQQVPSLMQNATIDKVSIAVTPPPLPNQWQWWLNLSPYGQQLLSLLQANTSGGHYISGPYVGITGFSPNSGYWCREA